MAVVACRHCGQASADGGEFCCRGCRAVYGLLHEQGLERFYALRGGAGAPVPEVCVETRDRKWLEPVIARLAAASGTTSVECDVQGIHCTACVWLLEELFRRRGAGGSLVVNPVSGRASLLVGEGFDIAAWASEVERFGYLLGPPGARAHAGTDELLLRLGISIALGG